MLKTLREKILFASYQFKFNNEIAVDVILYVLI